MLKIQFSDASHEPVWVIEKLFSIGTRADNHLTLSDPEADPVHARLVFENRTYLLKDNNSRNGCFINNQRVTCKEVVPGDLIRIGNTELLILDPATDIISSEQPAWTLVADNHWMAGKSFVIPLHRPVLVGRDSQCDIVIPGTHVSRRHATLEVDQGKVRVTNLSSSGGTFINDARIDQHLAESNDQFRIDVYSFRLVAPDQSDESRARTRQALPLDTRPVERKFAKDAPRRWKTRPTSPGNRVESEELRTGIGRGRILLIILGLLTLLIATSLVWYPGKTPGDSIQPDSTPSETTDTRTD